ncbi:MAG: zinc-binding dehydrogenase [Desulfobacteraceae bacterium]|nr:zinc-binding dehydrogenase [Desulfobacteraceae bacterium]
MNKAIYYGIRDVRVEDVPEPEIGPGQVKIAIKYCGICGSDLHEYLHGPFPNTVFGHEACGTITAVGAGVNGFSVGERVCSVFPGAFAQAIVCPQQQLLKIPDSMSWERAALLEPLAGAAYAIERGNIQPSDTVFIAGAGPVGLMVLLGLKAMGVQTIYMTDMVAQRRRKAEELGAALVWDPLETKTPAKIKTLTNGRGVDIAVEAVGVEASLKDCLASTRQRGTVVVQGIFTQRAMVHMFGFVVRETTMIGTNAINPALAHKWLSDGAIAPERIVTDMVPLADIVSNGFEALAGPDKRAIKILIHN